MDHIDPTHEPAYPPLDRAAFLIERACVPRYYPTFCAETAQLLALLEEAQQKGAPQEHSLNPSYPPRRTS